MLVSGALTCAHAAEITFPVPPEVSSSLLSITSGVVTAAQIMVGTALLQRNAGDAVCPASPLATPFAAFVAANAAAGLLCVAALRAEYRREAAEARASTHLEAAAAKQALPRELVVNLSDSASYGTQSPL
jgi:hypothetical protein